MLDYIEYISLGGSADGESFPRLEMRARGIIDYRTQGRLSLLNPVPCEIKLLVAEIIDRLYAEKSDGAAVVSASNDGVSVTYASPESKSKALNDELYRLIDSVAGNLAYRGVD